MKVTEKKRESCQMVLNVEMEKAEVEEYLEKSYKKLVQKYKIPGFRQGKAPRTVLESHIGKDALLNSALDDLLPKAIQDLVEEEKVAVFARPTVEIIGTEPVTFKAIVPMPPEVKPGDYNAIRIKLQKVTVKKAEVDAIIEKLRLGRATWEPVERPVKYDDLAVIDIKGTIGELTCINQEGAQYPVHQDAIFPAPGFPDKLVGMKREEERKFKISFPKEFSQPELAGKEVSFKVKLLEVKEEKLPEMNDVLASEIDSEFKTLADLRRRVEENMQLRAEEKATRDYENEVIDAAVKMSEVEYPPMLLDMEIDNLVSRQMQELQRRVSNPEEFHRRLAETPPEKVREALRLEAEERVTRALVLGKIAATEQLKVEDSEVRTEIDLITRDISDVNKMQEQKKALNSPENLDQIYHMLLTRKTIDLLVDTAKGSATAKKSVGQEEAASPEAKTKPAARKSTTAKAKKTAKEAK